MNRSTLEEMATPNQVAEHLLNALDVNGIREALLQGLHLPGTRTFTVAFFDASSGNFATYFGSDETQAAVIPGELSAELCSVLERGDGKFMAINSRETLGATVPVRAVASLSFRGEKYGVVLLHALESEDPGRWDVIGPVLGAGIVKAQLYESTHREAGSSGLKVDALNQAGELVKYVELEPLLAKLMELSVKIMNAQVGAVVLKQGDRLTTGIEWGLTESFLLSLRSPSGDPFLRTVLDTGKSVLVEDVRSNPHLAAPELDVDLQSLLAIPLVTQSRKLGLIVIVNSDAGGLQPEDFEVLTTIANLSASAVESAVLYKEAIEHERISAEMDLASDVQADLLPGSAPEVPHLELVGWNMRCTETGGDYYDYLPLESGSTGVVVGDATGHGMGAALMMFITRSTLRALLTGTQDPVKILAKMNDLIEESSEPNRFMTLFLGIIDPPARRMVYASAGHDQPFLCRANGKDEDVPYGATGMPLGVLAGSAFGTRELELRPGDFWLFGTDGIWEARNPSGEFYGKERLQELMRSTMDLPLFEASDVIRKDILDFHDGAEQLDDITAVLMRVVD